MTHPEPNTVIVDLLERLEPGTSPDPRDWTIGGRPLTPHERRCVGNARWVDLEAAEEAHRP